ncbi:MAG: endo-1,4-beta-xylanase [Fibrobacter sp.]|nr:endo-1,4-beta-xylanase [Fibrobacter sp.]
MKKKKILSSVALAAALAAPAFAGPGLADGAAKFVGNITTGGQVRSDFGQYWNQITAENECKWGSINNAENSYNWSGCDRAYNWAKQNGGHFKFHALVWGSQYPNWIKGLSATKTAEVIEKWMKAVADHYNPMGGIEMIDVVNEAIRTGNNQYHSGYTQTNIIPALGGDTGNYEFVVNAFKMARKYFPNSILIYNDYNTVQWNKDQGIDLIQKIKKGGAPVDGYGLQAHDMMSQGGGAGGTGGGGTCLNINTLKSVVNEIWTKTQTPIFISEYDIASTNDDVQKQCYSEQISYFMENEHVAGITIWGYIYGQTWLDCNGTASGCSGIIKNGQDRKAMTWLKEYLKSNKGVNTTGLAGGTTVDPEPQTPFKGQPIAIPGKIEAEDFDIPGVGRNEDGSSNYSYNVGDAGHGNSDYRKGEAPNLYESGSGVVIGYNQTGNWYEYTIDVAEAGTYTVYAAVASANSTSSFQLSIGEKNISEKIAVPAAAQGEENYNDYNKVAFDIDLAKGKQILRLNITGDWCDIDYMDIVKKGDIDPNPIPKSSSSAEEQVPGSSSSAGEVGPGMAIHQNLDMNMDVLEDYDVFDMNGVFMGRLSAYSMDQAVETVKFGEVKFAKGVYYVRNKTTHQMQTVRFTK